MERLDRHYLMQMIKINIIINGMNQHCILLSDLMNWEGYSIIMYSHQKYITEIQSWRKVRQTQTGEISTNNWPARFKNVNVTKEPWKTKKGSVIVSF